MVRSELTFLQEFATSRLWCCKATDSRRATYAAVNKFFFSLLALLCVLCLVSSLLSFADVEAASGVDPEDVAGLLAKMPALVLPGTSLDRHV